MRKTIIRASERNELVTTSVQPRIRATTNPLRTFFLRSAQRFGESNRITNIDVANKVATLSSGETITYTNLLSTMPLDIMLSMVRENFAETKTEVPPTIDLAPKLVYSSSHIIGIGLRGVNPHDTKCWLYFPEDDCPFYRGTVFSHYGDGNVPNKGELGVSEQILRAMCEQSLCSKNMPFFCLFFQNEMAS